MTIRSIALFLATSALLVGAVPSHAQSVAFRAGVGAAVPVGETADRRSAGPAAVVSVESRLDSRWGVRVDGEWSVLRAATPAGPEHGSRGGIRTVGVSLNGTLKLPAGDYAPYLLAGIGAYRLQDRNQRRSPYGTTGAVQAGLGIEGPAWGRISPWGEARALVHATDYGSADWSPTVYLPLALGLRVR
jgi:hypothetical protein